MQQEHRAIESMVQMEGYLRVLAKALKYDKCEEYVTVVERLQVLLSVAMNEVQRTGVGERSRGRASAR